MVYEYQTQYQIQYQIQIQIQTLIKSILSENFVSDKIKFINSDNYTKTISVQNIKKGEILHLFQ
jgi:hypothetical protein